MELHEKIAKLIEQRKNDPNEVVDDLLFSINEQICQKMCMKKITKAQLADMLGVSRPYVTKILTGKPNMTIKTLASIANVLGLKFKENIFAEQEILRLHSPFYSEKKQGIGYIEREGKNEEKQFVIAS